MCPHAKRQQTLTVNTLGLVWFIIRAFLSDASIARRMDVVH
jgi:hypothetical protein